MLDYKSYILKVILLKFYYKSYIKKDILKKIYNKTYVKKVIIFRKDGVLSHPFSNFWGVGWVGGVSCTVFHSKNGIEPKETENIRQGMFR
jgi:hypothetical protein